MNQLVTIRQVKQIIPIEGIKHVEMVEIQGVPHDPSDRLRCVVLKGIFRIDDIGLYFEIGSILPKDDERWTFLADQDFRVLDIELHGVLSQGLFMPMLTLTDEEAHRWRLAATIQGAETLDDILGVKKYEQA